MKYSTSINLGLGTKHYANVPGEYLTSKAAIEAANKFITKKHIPAAKIIMWVEN